LGSGRGSDRPGRPGALITLGAQQRKVRLYQECLGIRSVGGVHTNTDARSDVQILVFDVVRRGDRSEQLVGAEGRVLCTSYFGQQDHEFIAALAAYGVRSAHSRHQSTRD